MYLFARTLQVHGDVRAAIAWATTITEKAAQTTGSPVNLWSRVYSEGVGTLAFVMTAPDHTALEGFSDKLMVDDGYLELVTQGQKHIIQGTVNDRLSQIIHPTEMPDTPPGEYAVVISSTCANGCIAEGLALGVELAQRSTELTGHVTTFSVDSGGNFGAVSWATVYPSASEMERASQAQFGDAAFIEMIDKKAGRVYSDAPTATTEFTYRRLL